MSRYQETKAKRIVAFVTSLHVSHTRHQLAQCVALLSFDQWRTLCFTAGEPVADLDAKAATLAMLRGRTIHAL